MNFRKSYGSRRVAPTASGAVGAIGTELPRLLRAGNRFGETSVIFALLALPCSAVAALESVAWALAPMGLLLGVAGFVLWCQSRATNLGDSIVGTVLALGAVMWLLLTLSIRYPMPITTIPVYSMS